MRRGVLFCFIIFQNLLTPGYSQFLDSAALNNQKVYNNYEEAMKEPLKVYKLNILNPGYVPYNIDTLKNLQSLVLYGNDWDYALISLPESIGNLEKLQELCIRNTDLKVLPREIRCLKNLKTINCENLTVLPGELDSLISLENLYLCEIENIPSGFSKLTKLKKFSIYKTKNFPANKYLEQLSVSPRMLANVLDPSLFPNVNNLILLPNNYYGDVLVDMDSIKAAVDKIEKFPLLTKLDLKQVCLNDKIWSMIIALKNLESLGLNYYTKLPAKINSLKKLKKLSFIADSTNCIAVSKLPLLEEIETPSFTKEIRKLGRLRKVTIIPNEEYRGELSTERMITLLSKLPFLEEVKGLSLDPSTLGQALEELKSLKSIDLTITQNMFGPDSTAHNIAIALEDISMHPKLEKITIPWIGVPEQFAKLKTLKKLVIKYYVSEKSVTENDKLKLSLLLPNCDIQYETY